MTKVSEKCFAFLKNEIQIICFFHLNQLANISSLKAVFIKRNNFGNINNDKTDMKPSQDSNSTTEAEIIIDELIHHIDTIYNVFKHVLPREIISILIFPLCTIIPRILMR